MKRTLSRPATALARVPLSTYRLQLSATMTFEQAAGLVGYLDRLGITDLYASPSFRAAPGSPHGYDICDHRELNPELGGDKGFARLGAALRQHGLGLLLDFVPNHMAADAVANPWWQDVLENGPSSPYARFFDIDWHPLKAELDNKVLLPVLGDHYGRVLERGELRVLYRDGRFELAYFEHRLPLNPRQMSHLLGFDLETLKAALPPDSADLREFLSVITALQNLPVYTETEPARIEIRQREKEVARERLLRLSAANATIREHIERNVTRFNGTPGDAASFDLLHDLLEAQAYRLAFWRTALHEINYRRFFDINGLAGVRVEDDDVFVEVHQGLLRLVRDGAVTGVRLDHIDGLLDPRGYLRRLEEVLRDADGRPLYVLVEKILTGNERLPEDFRLDGTTGYDFLNEVNGVLVDGRGALPLKDLCARFTGRTTPFAEVVYQSKQLIAGSSLASELAVLSNALDRVSEHDRRSRDFTLISLHEALREVVACFPVYRTYLGDAGATGSDAEVIETAIAQARRHNPAVESSVFDFLRSVLLARKTEETPEALAREQRDFALKLQQYTGPLQAKGVEDTAFYRHNVLVALNEVGGDPQRFGISVRAFHQANQQRRERWPYTMLATSTHDTKRGEDARCRLDALSEIPDTWAEHVARWSRLCAAARTNVDGEPAPDRGDEYLFYQALLGAWPATSATDEGIEPPDGLVDRMQAYMLKALREAKLHTSWVNNNRAYEQATLQFVAQVLDPKTGQAFLASFAPLRARIAFQGMLNSLSQLVLKLASPGVPDFYQGCETWNLSLADPDNRCPVDFPALARDLARMEPYLDERTTTGRRRSFLTALLRSWHRKPATRRRSFVAGLLRSWQDGRIKHFITAAGLRLRRQLAPVFLDGEYLPLDVEGARREHVVALGRRADRTLVVAVAPRLCGGLGAASLRLPVGARVWRDTRIGLPAGTSGLVDVLTGTPVEPQGNDEARTLAVAEILDELPVALLVTAADSDGSQP
ncbi:MAG: malto-oligosyltrehalose synthase [Deltaproteobacteria bacterium]|nr:malto-oligosyltrehalose synthase [Deltaproteobacteria bacterium]